jgi:hypothetical protein
MEDQLRTFIGTFAGLLAFGRLGTSRTDRDPADASGDRCGPINRARASGLRARLAPHGLARSLRILALGPLRSLRARILTAPSSAAR